VDQALARFTLRSLKRRAKPRVLAIVDRPDWAIDHKARNLQRVLADRYDIVRRFQDRFTEQDVRAADIVLIFYWLELRKMHLPRTVLAANRDRLVMGICSHTELEGARRERGLTVLRRLPRAVFVNNRSLEREYASLLTVPVHYTPNGVDTTFFCPSAEPEPARSAELRVGWAGSLENHGAAHRRFHEVIEPAVSAIPGATLETAVREQRWRDQDQMLEFYRGLDVYVCASVSEGSPNPCLEAAACGVPVVTTRVGNMPEFIEEGVNGLFFDGTVGQLVDRLTLLRDAPATHASMSAAIRTSALAWDWRAQAENYARMFETLL
jgi:glycosyltransferase involved in cell wall biosynthesis